MMLLLLIIVILQLLSYGMGFWSKVIRLLLKYALDHALNIILFLWYPSYII